MEGLFVAFMASVVGLLLYIQLQLHGIAKKISPEKRRRYPRGQYPRDDLRSD